MKNSFKNNFSLMSKTAAVLLAAIVLITACFSLVSCVDQGGDDPGTESGSTASPEKDVPTFTVAENGASAYKLVIEGDPGESVEDAVSFLSYKLGRDGIEIPEAEKGEKPEKRIIVRISSDFEDPEGGILSFEGYRIFADGNNNIVITGGNVESTCAACVYFGNMFKDCSLKLEEGFEYNYHPFKKLDGFYVKGVPVAEFSVEGISGDSLTESAAKYVKKLLFTHAGAYVGDNKDTEHKIYFKYGFEDSSEGVVTVEEGNLCVTGNKKIGFYRVFRDFLELLAGIRADYPDKKIDWFGEDGSESRAFAFDVDYGDFITYEEYGAVGDGTTDDSKAIKDAHDAQKETGRAVLAREDATYYFGKSAKISKITGNVDWSTAHFTIDDSELKGAGSNIFSIPAAGKSSSVKSDLKQLSAGQENVGVTFRSKGLLTVTNDSVKQYIRKGANQDAGSSQKEIILVDESGNVDPSTPVIWDYKKITSATFTPANDEVITVKGGIFTTVANQAASQYNYYNRGIEIQRSNAVITDVAHYITGEGDTGAPYNGFLYVSNTYNLTVKDTVLTPHMTYITMGSGNTLTPMGSYDCQVTNTVGLNFINVIQSRSINDATYWGTFASNYSRNISFDGCVLGRFDAHKGVYNVTLKNSSFGHQGINLIGHGVALIENCNIFAKNIINLRDDYGSTWDGDLIIRNCVYYPRFGVFQDAELIGGDNTFDHNFGYTCYLPRNIVIDGLYVNDSHSLSGNAPMLFADINSKWTSADYKGKFPMVMTESVSVKGFESYSDKALEPSANMFMFKDLTINYVN